METAEDVATLGRKVASAQGFNPRTPGFDAASYGREARYALARGKGVPDPHDFVEGGSAQGPAQPAQSRVDEGRRIRIGRVEMRLSEEAPARHRPQHHRHAGQRSSGRYRRLPGEHPPPYVRETVSGVVRQYDVDVQGRTVDLMRVPEAQVRRWHREGLISDYDFGYLERHYAGYPRTRGLRLTSRSPRARYRRR